MYLDQIVDYKNNIKMTISMLQQAIKIMGDI